MYSGVKISARRRSDAAPAGCTTRAAARRRGESERSQRARGRGRDAAREGQTRTRAPLPADPTDEGTARDGRAQCEQRVDRHDPAAELGRRPDLHVRVRGRPEEHRRHADRHQQDHGHDLVGSARGRDEREPEGSRGADDGLRCRAGVRGRGQPADHGPDPEDGHEEPGEIGAAVERSLRQQRQEGREVVDEGPHHGDERDRRPDLGDAPRIYEALAYPGALGVPVRTVQVGRTHRDERGDDREEGDRVHEEHPRCPDGADEESGQGGSGDAGRVADGTGERDRVGQELGSDHLFGERVTGGLVDDGDEAEPDREAEHHPYLHHPGEHDEPKRDRERGGQRLGDDEHLAPVEPVGDRSAPQSEQQHGKESEGECRAHRDSLAGELQDEPRLGHGLHPRPDVRHEIAREIQAVVVAVE